MATFKFSRFPIEIADIKDVGPGAARQARGLSRDDLEPDGRLARIVFHGREPPKGNGRRGPIRGRNDLRDIGPRKNNRTFSRGEAFFLLTRPSMGDPVHASFGPKTSALEGDSVHLGAAIELLLLHLSEPLLDFPLLHRAAASVRILANRRKILRERQIAADQCDA